MGTIRRKVSGKQRPVSNHSVQYLHNLKLKCPNFLTEDCQPTTYTTQSADSILIQTIPIFLSIQIEHKTAATRE